MSRLDKNPAHDISREFSTARGARNLRSTHQENTRSLQDLVDKKILKKGQEINAQFPGDDQPDEIYKIADFNLRLGAVILERKRDGLRTDVSVHSDAIQTIVKLTSQSVSSEPSAK